MLLNSVVDIVDFLTSVVKLVHTLVEDSGEFLECRDGNLLVATAESRVLSLSAIGCLRQMLHIALIRTCLPGAWLNFVIVIMNVVGFLYFSRRGLCGFFNFN